MSNSNELAATPTRVVDSQDKPLAGDNQNNNKINADVVQLLSEKAILNYIDRVARIPAEAVLAGAKFANQCFSPEKDGKSSGAAEARPASKTENNKHSDTTKKAERVDAQEAALLKELESAEKKYGKVSKEAAHVLEKLGLHCIKQHRYENAKEYVQKAVKVYDVVYGKDSISSASCHSVLGELNIKLGDNKEAAKEFETALDICRKNNPTKDKTAAGLFLITAQTYVNELLNKTGDDKRIKELFREMQMIMIAQGGGTLIRNPDGTISVSVSW
jgi:tetratricopeptide (TPR) repeat protein